MERNILEVRVIHGAFLMTIFLFVVVCRISAPPEQPISYATVTAFVGVAIADIALGLVRRQQLSRDSAEVARSEANMSKALNHWRMFNITSFVHAETVALFGVALKFLGASWAIAAGFFVIGFALLVFWTPRTPVWMHPVMPPISRD